MLVRQTQLKRKLTTAQQARNGLKVYLHQMLGSKGKHGGKVKILNSSRKIRKLDWQKVLEDRSIRKEVQEDLLLLRCRIEKSTRIKQKGFYLTNLLRFFFTLKMLVTDSELLEEQEKQEFHHTIDLAIQWNLRAEGEQQLLVQTHIQEEPSWQSATLQVASNHELPQTKDEQYNEGSTLEIGYQFLSPLIRHVSTAQQWIDPFELAFRDGFNQFEEKQTIQALFQEFATE